MCHIKTSSGINWSYDIEGEGKQILFIHGWGVDRRIWNQQIKYFSQEYKVLSIDLPGHGKSSWEGVSLDVIARDIKEILEKLDFNESGVVGSSLGGLIALKILEIDPKIFKFVSFVGSQPKFLWSDDYPYGLTKDEVEHLAQQLRRSYPSMVNIFFRSLFTKKERATRRYKWIQTFRRNNVFPSKDALLHLLDLLMKEDLRETLYNLSIPIHFVNGMEDNVCRKETFNNIKEKIPSVRLDWFEECGHFPFLIKPHEFNTYLENFIQAVG